MIREQTNCLRRFLASIPIGGDQASVDTVSESIVCECSLVMRFAFCLFTTDDGSAGWQADDACTRRGSEVPAVTGSLSPANTCDRARPSGQWLVTSRGICQRRRYPHGSLSLDCRSSRICPVLGMARRQTKWGVTSPIQMFAFLWCPAGREGGDRRPPRRGIMRGHGEVTRGPGWKWGLRGPAKSIDSPGISPYNRAMKSDNSMLAIYVAGTHTRTSRERT